MKQRSRSLTPVLVFLVTLSLAFVGGFVARQNRSTAAGQGSTGDVTVPEVPTTAVPTTQPLALDSTIPDTSLPTEPKETTVATTEAPIATDAPRPDPQLTTEGAVLAPAGEGDRRLYDSTTDCASLSRSGSDSSSVCDRFPVADANLAWVIPSDEQGIDVLTLEPGTEDVYDVSLVTNRPVVRPPRTLDATGDGVPDLIFGWRSDAKVLDVDVVELREGRPVVTLHLSLDDGRVSAGNGQVEAWQAFRNDAGEVVSYDHWTYRKEGGRWVVDADEDKNPPSGQF